MGGSDSGFLNIDDDEEEQEAEKVFMWTTLKMIRAGAAEIHVKRV